MNTNAGTKPLIGLHVTAAVSDLPGTLAAIFESTSQPFSLVLLVDPAPGEAAALAPVLEQLANIPKLIAPCAGGAASCFNLLIAQQAELVVFLECGVRPGPNWLRLLQAAIDSDPEIGLAGPSTNLGWNAQTVAPGCGATSPEITTQAAALLATYGTGWRSMAPLYSLADFCLAVRPQVIAAIGAADTAYGRGPCWEMDYAARAARAGFTSAWVPAAFVHRAPMLPWRAAAEPADLASNKRLYQDRFCGRRRDNLPYHAHCAGDACADFARAGTRLHLPLSAANPPEAKPLISCIMPTRGRPKFVAQALEYFRRQTYPHRELIIVYEQPSDLPGPIPDSNVVTVQTAQTSIGAKRNVAVAAARGEIIAHWDDDDWYAPDRLAAQAQPIISGFADITGLNDLLFFDLPAQKFWSITPELSRRLFVENISGGTLMFRRVFFDRGGPYPAISMREDVSLMAKAMRAGARLCRLPGRELCIYVRHETVTWKFGAGQFLQPEGWSTAPEPDFLAPDRKFYTPAVAAPPRAGLVSCLMPTANRRPFIAAAIAQFLAQDYPEKELVILDDGEDPIADLIPPEPSLRYIRATRHKTLGAKRNAACAAARGEIMLHWDDDDWYAPNRISLQVAALRKSGAGLCGIDRILFIDKRAPAAWEYVYPGGRPWVYGAAFCFTRDFWQQHRFPEVNMGEDTSFAACAEHAQLHVMPENHFFVALIHGANTSPKNTSDPRWRRADFPTVKALTGAFWPPQ